MKPSRSGSKKSRGKLDAKRMSVVVLPEQIPNTTNLLEVPKSDFFTQNNNFPKAAQGSGNLTTVLIPDLKPHDKIR